MKNIMKIKICIKCGKEKDMEEFGRYFDTQNNKYYYRNACKVCESKRTKQWHKDNPDCYKRYHETHKECILERSKQWRKDNLDRSREIDRWYYETHKEEKKERNRKYLKNNRHKIYAKTDEWRRANLDKINASRAKSRAAKRNQTPANANKEDIKYVYYIARVITQKFDEEYQVDHIKPLSKGGLHHQNNLQILLKLLNGEKRDKWPLTKEEKIRYKGLTLEDCRNNEEVIKNVRNNWQHDDRKY